MHKPIVMTLRILCVSLLLQAQPVWAFDFADGRIHLNTYGTVGIAKIDDPDIKFFRSTSLQGPTLSDGWRWDYDSRLGVQLEANITDKLDVVWQGLLQRDLDDDTSLDTKWAFIKYRPTPWLDIKLGRFMTPFYQISDQMYVGYAHPWVRPPQEVYGLVGKLDSSDGLWMRFRLPTKEFNTSVDASISRYTETQPGARIVISPLITTSLNISKGDWAVRATAARAPVALSGPLVKSFDALLDTPMASHRYGITGEDVWYYNLGFKYQNTDWYASGEYVRLDANDNYSLGDVQAMTVTLGHYWGNWLPYVVYSRLDALNTKPETGLGGLGQLVAQSLIDARKNDKSTFGVGVRWDFHPGYALKAQVDWINTPSGNRGLFDTEPSGQVRAYSFALEWAL